MRPILVRELEICGAGAIFLRVTMLPLHIVMRADASPQIGLGHVKRCLSLASALRVAGAEVHLVSRDFGVDVASLAAVHGVALTLLPRRPDGGYAACNMPHGRWALVSQEQDVLEFLAAIRGLTPQWVIVDHYAFDATWHRAVAEQSHAAIAVIDDLADRRIAADLLIDHNYAADHRIKYADCLAADVPILGGPRFALLSPAYSAATPYVWNQVVHSIGIFMGGLDEPNWSGVVLRACREQARFSGPIEVVTMPDNPNLGLLRALAESWPNTVVRTGLADLAGFFASHDLQIGAGGGAAWERCCIGVPTLTLAPAENQRVVTAALEAKGAVASIEDLSTAAIGKAVRSLIDAPRERYRLASRSRMLVDGLGARRVALKICASRLQLRAAGLGDAALMHRWRNDPSVRNVSVDSMPIPWPQHLQWLERVLGDTDRLLQIASIGSIAVGVIRFDGIGGPESEVSLYLDPALQGLGLGRCMLMVGEREVRRRSATVQQILATVLDVNVVSERMFAAAGYQRRSDGRWIKLIQA